MAERQEIEIIPKVSPDSLDLVPFHDPDNKDQGWSSVEIEATSKILAGLFKLPGFDGVYPLIIAQSIKPALEIQLAAALEREERENAEARRMGRRTFLRRAFGWGVGLTVTGLGVNKYVNSWNDYYSPEAVAARVAEEYRKKEEFEKNHTLGLAPSTISTL